MVKLVHIFTVNLVDNGIIYTLTDAGVLPSAVFLSFFFFGHGASTYQWIL